MFGYVKPHTPYLYLKDDTLYKSLYCGVCKSIGATCGQMARFGLTYDIAFLSAIAHNIMGKDVVIKRKHCVLHPIIKRPIAQRDAISDTLGYLNTILAYFKVRDDILDNGRGRFKKLFLNGGYKRAKKHNKELVSVVEARYNELNSLEKSGETSIDRVCEPFAAMLKELSELILKEHKTEFTSNLFYALGKWIYLIDALDDYDKDVKKGNFNPLYLSFKDKTKLELIKTHGNDISFIMGSVIEDINLNNEKITYLFNKDLINNVLKLGLVETTKKIMESSK